MQGVVFGIGTHGNSFPSTPPSGSDKDTTTRLLAENDVAIGRLKSEAETLRKQRLGAAQAHAQSAQAKAAEEAQILAAHNQALAQAQLA